MDDQVCLCGLRHLNEWRLLFSSTDVFLGMNSHLQLADTVDEFTSLKTIPWYMLLFYLSIFLSLLTAEPLCTAKYTISAIMFNVCYIVIT